MEPTTIDSPEAERDGLSVPEVLKQYKHSGVHTAFFRKTVKGVPIFCSVQYPKHLKVEDVVLFTKDDVEGMLRILTDETTKSAHILKTLLPPVLE